MEIIISLIAGIIIGVLIGLTNKGININIIPAEEPKSELAELNETAKEEIREMEKARVDFLNKFNQEFMGIGGSEND